MLPKQNGVGAPVTEITVTQRPRSSSPRSSGPKPRAPTAHPAASPPGAAAMVAASSTPRSRLHAGAQGRPLCLLRKGSMDCLLLPYFAYHRRQVWHSFRTLPTGQPAQQFLKSCVNTQNIFCFYCAFGELANGRKLKEKNKTLTKNIKKHR